MQIKVEIDPNCQEPTLLIKTNQMTDEISQQKIITGFHNDIIELLDVNEVIRLYSLDKKVYAQTATKKFIIQLRLYEWEERLNDQHFVRISHFEIVNLKAIQKIDLSFIGTIAVVLSNQITTYISRRYVTKIKKHIDESKFFID